MDRRPGIIAGALAFAAVGLWVAVTVASDEIDELVPGKVVIVKPGKLAKFIAKPLVGSFDLPDSTNDPIIEGGSLNMYDTAGVSNDTYALPPGGWKGLGNPAGSKGYKYKGAGSAGDPCKVVLVKPNIVKAVCKGTDVT